MSDLIVPLTPKRHYVIR